MKSTVLDRVFDGVILCLMLVALYFVFIWVPNEKTMGIIQRIFYFHVPAAWVAFLAFGIVFAASIAYLVSRNDHWDLIAAISAELGLVFCSIMLITGPIWAKPVWGIWWTWDPRLTLALVLWLIYVAYVMLRIYIDDEGKRARLSAVVGIIGFLDVPLVYMSIRWWRTQHPAAVMGGGEKSGLAPEMMLTFVICLVTFTALFFYLLQKRYGIEKAEQEINELYKKIGDRD
ncbi:cytochrome C assembly protein [bacterium]|nr:MAG: cytochrome C assembly protein [bacterium]MBL7959124.1 cytochrome c biogenesis protein CcsA [bacterium]